MGVFANIRIEVVEALNGRLLRVADELPGPPRYDHKGYPYNYRWTEKRSLSASENEETNRCGPLTTG